ncbi:MAG: hypothetical protein R3B82_21640 [Sandaracinaceae bacterium]
MSIAPPPPDAPWALVIAHDPREADELAGLIARHRSVRCATRIAEVMRLLALHSSVQLVCVDLDLPGEAAALLFRTIRADRRFDHVQVVGFGGETAERHVAAIRAGAGAVLSTPVRARTVEGVVRRRRRTLPPKAA